MPDAVEIYLCKPGQKLTEGRLVLSNGIGGKDDAIADAEMRCRADPTLARVAYYAVNENGDFRILCTYTNPNAKRLGAATDAAPKKKKKRRRRKKKTLWQKIKAAAGF